MLFIRFSCTTAYNFQDRKISTKKAQELIPEPVVNLDYIFEADRYPSQIDSY
jgi:hypothetical protein